MAANHWMITRPKRKLILVPELLKIFNAAASGSKWDRNRVLHVKFEQALTSAGWKAQNISKDGSGGRTYAVLLYMLGLWYEDSDVVNLTLAGQEIIDGVSPVKVLTKQLLNFQYPSAYSTNRFVNVSKVFRLRPYQFILRILLEKGYSEITQNEIAFCLVPFAKSEKDLDNCSMLIEEYRRNEDIVRDKAIIESNTSADNLKNIGNTAVNQLLYTGFFVEGDNVKSLIITNEGRKKSKDLIDRLPISLIPYTGDDVTYQRKYGTGTEKSKDYSNSKRNKMDISPNERLILTQAYVIASREPITDRDDFVKKIMEATGETTYAVDAILNKIPVESQKDRFSQVYLEISKGGAEFAKDFEQKTTSLLTAGFSLSAEWVGKKPRHPDIFLYLDKVNHTHGIIDTKAYREYNLPLDHKNKMAYTYIPGFKVIISEGETYDLAFFGYIAGGYSSGMSKSFSELISMVKIPGSYMTARTFLKLYTVHKENRLIPTEFLRLFSLNREVKPDDII